MNGVTHDSHDAGITRVTTVYEPQLGEVGTCTPLHYDCADGGVQLYGGLQKLELVVNSDEGCDLKRFSSAMEDLAQLMRGWRP